MNVVVTLHAGHFGLAMRLLEPLAHVKRTPFFNVLSLDADEPRAVLEKLSEHPDATEVRAAVAHVVPLSLTFTFQDPAQFEERAREAVRALVPRLAGCSFHVRFHRRGFKERISTIDEEQTLDRFLLDALEKAGTPGEIAFKDPDAIVALEMVGQHAGVSLWRREELARYPLLGLH